MLEYENQMFLDILHDDGLVVCAKGLGIENVFINILKVYLDPGNLVIVLGTNDHDECYFINRLESLGVKFLPRVITAQFPANERELMYLDGGVLFVSGRIFVVDLLKNRVPLKLVTGILVYRAHNILNSFQEAFALRLYRQNNKTGFIKAFTNSALAFTVGFAQVERVMKSLFVKQLYLWPRFHALVSNSLSKSKPEVIELHAKLTPKMLNIQIALLDVMNYTVNELKRINKYLELDDVTVENVIAKKFHKLLQHQLDPIWHQLSFKTKQLVADLKTLRSLLVSLNHEDSVSFYATLNRLRTAEYAMNSSGWLLLDCVENLFVSGKRRVYNEKDELKPEASPKWIALSEILREIQDNINTNKTDPDELQKVLVLVQDKITCNQLKGYLTMGAGEYLLYRAMSKLQPSKISKPNDQNADAFPASNLPPSSEANESIEDTAEKDSYVLTLSQKPSNADCAEQFEECSQLDELDLSTISKVAPLVVIQSLKKNGDPTALLQTLSEMMPTYVILYSADISAVRQLEVYQSNNPSIKLKVFFLIYGGSVEEQAYLTSLRREKEAFNMLINTKATMVVSEDQDGKTDECQTLVRGTSGPVADAENTRKGGVQEDVPRLVEKIIVDMREFRSELPALIHKRGIEIEPVTLLIGDYILSPEICVERKSISDLIGSLNSGRLYNQAVAMTRHYAKPMLLIEFDPNKPFCFQNNYFLSADTKSSEVTAKLQLLTLHFPKLKLIWSPSPSATSQLFEELKKDRAQPDALKAAQIGVEENVDEEFIVDKYNKIQDLVSKLPGVNSKNIRALLNKGESLDHLITLSQAELTEILGNSGDAQLLHDALHKRNTLKEELPASRSGRGGSKVRGRGLFRKKK
ncbi:DNA repair endonuclease XPF isoform X1 [Diprion similis]|uniref:DNA repair endonuclease XPF isoform X1 n=1 Tax=Diprion similis TaxID=362088 RepID=UPI001EF8DF95|nr:DNA repair endonuclease XPF isoform X1 [Diprion similis]